MNLLIYKYILHNLGSDNRRLTDSSSVDPIYSVVDGKAKIKCLSADLNLEPSISKNKKEEGGVGIPVSGLIQ